MQPKCWILLFVVALLLTIPAFAVDAPANLPDTSNSWDVDVMLRSVIYLPTPRPVQDVFFMLNNTTPNLVYRIERSQANDSTILAKEAYATVNATPHDTYKITPHPLGPFPKGVNLGFTLEQWLSAIGNGTYIEENGNATMNLTFKNLVPNGTYTVWIHRVTMPPNYGEIFTPVGASNGSQNVFKADSMGNATYNMKLKALPESTNVTFKDYVAMYVTKKAPITTNITWTLISVVYHSDGKTHGVVPGELGKTAHVQMTHLMYPKPSRTYQAWIAGTPVTTPAQSEGIYTTEGATTNATTPAPKPATPGFEGIFAITILLGIGYFVLGKYE